MGASEFLAKVFFVGIGFILFAILFKSADVPNWSDFAAVGGVMVFTVISVTVGFLSKSVGLAIASGAAITGLIEAYVYVEFAEVMGLIFGGVVVLALVVAYFESSSSSQYGGFGY
jgi:hypothetical protein